MSSDTLSNGRYQIVVDAFGDAVRAAAGKPIISFDPEECTWFVRVDTEHGVATLNHAQGGGFSALQGLLQILAGAGIVDATVEFGGLPPLYYDRVN